MGVRIGSGLSGEQDARIASADAAFAARKALRGAPCDLVLLFVCGSHLAAPEATLEAVYDVLSPTRLIGCCASGVIAGNREIEHGTGVAVCAMSFDHGSVQPFETIAELVTEEAVALSGMPNFYGASGGLLLVDPLTFPTNTILGALSDRGTPVPLVGGVASARTLEGSSALFFDEKVLDEGAVGVRFDGIEMLTCVSQGAIPLGPELTVTSVEDGMIHELAGKPALVKLRETVESLPFRDRRRLERGVLLGMVVEPNKPDYVQGDFLVRGLTGIDPASGTITLGTEVNTGQIVQLHAKDADRAHKNLKEAIASGRHLLGDKRKPAGALVFACNGRGVDMFGFPHHDAETLTHALSGAPTAGFFTSGEIGRVGDELLVNSFTATMAIFPA